MILSKAAPVARERKGAAREYVDANSLQPARPRKETDR